MDSSTGIGRLMNCSTPGRPSTHEGQVDFGNLTHRALTRWGRTGSVPETYPPKACGTPNRLAGVGAGR